MGHITDRLKHAWNAFNDQGPNTRKQDTRFVDYGASYGYRPDRSRFNVSNERSIITSVYTKLGMDVASVLLSHVKLDENGRFVETVNSGLNNCLTLEANIDQAARHFRQNIAMSLLDKGVIAICPVDTSIDPGVNGTTGGYDIKTLRVGEVVAWFPKHVRVNLYNDNTGRYEELTVSKTAVAIVENPLYSVMNEPNSTLQRLIRKLNLLDSVDEASSSGKLDLIVQLPYVIKSEARQQQAAQRRTDLEQQLRGSTYGIAYTDGTEKITQLNRPTENNLLKQVEYLTDLLYSQLGLTKSIFDGTADERTMTNYFSRTVDPILGAISEAMKRTFLTKTARTQGQSIEYFRNRFNLMGIADLAELADKLTRNEILSSNEFRALLGYKPSKDPKAEELRNKNLPVAEPPPEES